MSQVHMVHPFWMWVPKWDEKFEIFQENKGVYHIVAFAIYIKN